jgi:alkyldihydroxyacetonephosphate synthase
VTTHQGSSSPEPSTAPGGPGTPADPAGAARPAWSGWGHGEHGDLPEPAWRALVEQLGADPERRTPAVALADVRLPDSVLLAGPAGRSGLARLSEVVGAEWVRADHGERVRHAAGRSYLDLLRLRAGEPDGAPDAVVYPGDAGQVADVLAVCADAGVAVVPFGGGTSVVGGVAAERGPFEAVVALDLARLDRLVAVDGVSSTATLGAGMRGPAVEAALGARGLTLGHVPQSFEFATVGGWVATRSAGQASTGYGRIDELVHAVRCVTPAGELRLGRGPASAAGPRLLDLVVGSEGTLGVITEATLAVRPAPARRRYEGWSFPDLESGLAAFRGLAQRLGPGLAPDVCRLSDPDETRATFLLAGGKLATRLGRAYLELRGHAEGCLAIVGWEGTAANVGVRHRAAAGLLRAHRGVALGAAPGRSWRRGRFGAPYLRDTLLDRGLLVETLETAADWSALPALHAAVRDRLRAALGDRALVMTHLSHLYRTGASLYVTVLAARDPADPAGQWTAAKRAVTAELVGRGATVTHHHAVGRDHREYLPAEIGEVGVELLRAAKVAADPAGILNPGKLLPVMKQ